MNGTVLNDMIPIRKLGYINTFPIDVKSVGGTIESNDGDNCSVDSAKDTLIIPVVIGNKVKIWDGLSCCLCYPLGVKQAGTYLPESMLQTE